MEVDVIELTDTEFNELELQKKIKSVKRSIPSKEPNNPIEDIATDLTKAASSLQVISERPSPDLNSVADAIQKLVDKPDADTQDLSPLIQSLIDIQSQQNKMFDALAEKSNKEWEFAVERNSNGRINKIKAREI